MSNKLKIALVFLCVFLIGGITTFAVLVSIGRDDKGEAPHIDEYMATIVMKGYELSIPNQYKATILDTLGLMYWEEDYFDMYIIMEEGSYEEIKAALGNFTQEDYEVEGLEIIIPYKEIAIDGRTYIYMLYKDSERLMINCYSEIDDKMVCQVMLDCKELKNQGSRDVHELMLGGEELLIIADNILSTAKPTDKEDTAPGTVYMGQDVYEEWIGDQKIELEE